MYYILFEPLKSIGCISPTSSHNDIKLFVQIEDLKP